METKQEPIKLESKTYWRLKSLELEGQVLRSQVQQTLARFEQRRHETYKEAGLDASTVYRLDDTWALRFGYGMVWLTGVALAPDQFDFSASTLAGRAVDGNSTLWLGGGSLGLEARW